jgi:hypothetical protein
MPSPESTYAAYPQSFGGPALHHVSLTRIRWRPVWEALRRGDIRRIVPNLKVDDAETGHAFHTEFLGLKPEFDLGWVVSFRDPNNRSARVSLVSADGTAPEDSVMTVRVADVDAAHVRARELATRSSTP